MAGPKKFGLKIFLIFYALIIFAMSETDISKSGNCFCGGFPTETPERGTEPLISQAPGLTVTCDEKGVETCKNLCTALATAAKAKGPGILCQRIVNATKVKFSVFYKTCENPWTFGGMTADEPLCCENAEVKQCVSASVVPSNSTEPLPVSS